MAKNYIHTLQAENVALIAQVVAIRNELNDFRNHLATSKFHGVDNAWISVGDVNVRLRQIEAAGHAAFDNAGG